MKAILVSVLLALPAISSAETQIMSDPASAQFAKMLGGHALLCDQVGTLNYTQGFFPLTISAIPSGPGRTRLTVETADPKIGFGYGGSSFDPTERTRTWTILSCGDDGRNYLEIQNFDLKEQLASSLCDGPAVEGEIIGVLAGIWDAGTNDTTGLKCCIQETLAPQGDRPH